MPDTLVLFLAIVMISGSISLATVIFYDQARSRHRYSERTLHQDRQRGQRPGDLPVGRSRLGRYQDDPDRRIA